MQTLDVFYTKIILAILFEQGPSKDAQGLLTVLGLVQEASANTTTAHNKAFENDIFLSN